MSKCFQHILGLTLGILFSTVAGAQLLISNINLPEQGLLNQTLQSETVVLNSSDTSRIGSLKFFLINQSHPELGVYEFAGFSQLQFFAPLQPRIFSINLPLSDEYFRIGGNTVVIWPSMIGFGGDTLKITREIYIDEVSITSSPNDQISQIKIFPNPANDLLFVTISESLPCSYKIFGLDGKLALEGPLSQNQIAVNMLQSGLYFIQLFTSQGELIYRKIITVQH